MGIKVASDSSILYRCLQIYTCKHLKTKYPIENILSKVYINRLRDEQVSSR